MTAAGTLPPVPRPADGGKGPPRTLHPRPTRSASDPHELEPSRTLQGSLVEFINRVVRPQRIARAFTELRSTFANMSRVPDVSVYRWDRVPVDEQGNVADDFREAPDVAIEIISPGQSPTRLLHRCLSFIRAGVRAAILINPPDQSVLVIRPDREDLLLRRGDLLDLSDIIPELRLDLSALFDEMRHDLGP